MNDEELLGVIEGRNMNNAPRDVVVEITPDGHLAMKTYKGRLCLNTLYFSADAVDALADTLARAAGLVTRQESDR